MRRLRVKLPNFCNVATILTHVFCCQFVNFFINVSGSTNDSAPCRFAVARLSVAYCLVDEY